jgi:hypothetical protein
VYLGDLLCHPEPHGSIPKSLFFCLDIQGFRTRIDERKKRWVDCGQTKIGKQLPPTVRKKPIGSVSFWPCRGPPSADTFERVFQWIDPVAFELGFRQWGMQIIAPLGIKVVALDGKRTMLPILTSVRDKKRRD